jgi:anaerobic carbon-monoxide dehydrogenase iron sulfur subunit
MEKVIVIDPDYCTGCRICEMACSLSHVGQCNPERSRIRVLRDEEDGLIVCTPTTCLQCEDPMCIRSCPTGATYKGGPAGAKLVATQKCIGCSACVYACPFGQTFLDPVRRVAVRCDLCEGDPRCVKDCPTGALQWVSTDRLSLRLRRSKGTNMAEMQRIARMG